MMAPELLQNYHFRLKQLLDYERQTLKCLAKLSFAAFTDELRQALSPSSFDQLQHIDRLKACLKQVRIKDTKEFDESSSGLFSQAERARKSTRTPSLTRDLQLLHSGLGILNVSQCGYHELFLMATALKHQQAAVLLEQSWKDLQNAYGYLIQISANIVYPAATNEIAETAKQKSG